MACQGQIDFLGGHNGNKYLVTFLCYLGYINLYLPHHMLCTVYSIPNKSNQIKTPSSGTMKFDTAWSLGITIVKLRFHVCVSSPCA